MIKLVIDSINGYIYGFKDKNNKVYQYNIQFYDLDVIPEIGDAIFVNEGFLELENTMLSYGAMDGEYGRDITRATDDDLLVLLVNGENIYLKRFYG